LALTALIGLLQEYFASSVPGLSLAQIVKPGFFWLQADSWTQYHPNAAQRLILKENS